MSTDMDDDHRAWKVFVDDNFHFMDEDERYELGEFRTREEAVEACKRRVDDFLLQHLEDAASPEKLLDLYGSFGEDPFIIGPDHGDNFSAWEYAKQRCDELCSGPTSAVIRLPTLATPRSAEEGNGPNPPGYPFAKMSAEREKVLFQAGLALAEFDKELKSRMADQFVLNGSVDEDAIIARLNADKPDLFATISLVTLKTHPISNGPAGNTARTAETSSSTPTTSAEVRDFDEEATQALLRGLQEREQNSSTARPSGRSQSESQAETLADIANGLDEILHSQEQLGQRRTSRARQPHLSPTQRLSELDADWDYFYGRCMRFAALLESKIGPELTALLGRHQLEILALAGTTAYSGEALSVGFQEWFRLLIENPLYLRKNYPRVTAALVDCMSTKFPDLTTAVDGLAERYRNWQQTPHPQPKALILGDVVSQSRPLNRPMPTASTGSSSPASSWKSNSFWGVYLVVMHALWISAIAGKWDTLDWYDLWSFAAFQYVFASVWPIWMAVKVVGLL